VGFQAAIVRVLPQGFHDPGRPCPGENMRFFNPLAVAFAVDTVISVNRIFFIGMAERAEAEKFAGNQMPNSSLGNITGNILQIS
jgi:hypothetical protein